MTPGRFPTALEEDAMQVMRNRLVPRGEWPAFFDAFSHRYDGWLVTVRVLHPRFGSQMEACEVPLAGVVAPPYAPIISLHVGCAASHIEHDIRSPREVWVELSAAGAEEAIGIESEDGTKTIIEFKTPALPETNDGFPVR